MQGTKDVEGSEVADVCSRNSIGGGDKERGAGEFSKSFKNIPICSPDDLVKADAIILGAPTYLENM